MPTFRAGGLASGLDSASIIDSLVAVERQPIEKLQAAQKAVDVKISVLASLTGKLKAFETAVQALAKDGARGFKIAQQPAAIDVAVGVGAGAAGATAQAGRYSLEVSALAQAAKARSTGFASGETVRGGSLRISTDGQAFDVSLTDGASLEQVAAAIEASGAPVTASVLNDGTERHLVLTRTTTGHQIGAAASDALSIAETSTGASGTGSLGLATTTPAANARFSVDGLAFERRTNDVTDALPGTTLTLKEQTTAPQHLVIADDRAKTKEQLQKVVDAYNSIISVVQSELAIGADTDRKKTLGGEPALRLVQTRMQSLLTKELAGAGSGVKTLADLGVRSARNGSLSIDQATFDRAINADANAVDKLFDGGLEPAAKSVVSAFANNVDGALTLRSKGLSADKKRMDEQIALLEARVERHKELLVARFSAMEKVVSSLKATGNFLTSQSASANKDS